MAARIKAVDDTGAPVERKPRLRKDKNVFLRVSHVDQDGNAVDLPEGTRTVILGMLSQEEYVAAAVRGASLAGYTGFVLPGKSE